MTPTAASDLQATSDAAKLAMFPRLVEACEQTLAYIDSDSPTLAERNRIGDALEALLAEARTLQ